MLGSLRFRLPALFLLGIVLAGLVAALISIRFFQSYTRARAVDELRSESVGIVAALRAAGGPGDGAAGEPRAGARRRQHLLGAGVPGDRRCCRRIPNLPKDVLSIDRSAGAARRRRSRSRSAGAAT